MLPALAVLELSLATAPPPVEARDNDLAVTAGNDLAIVYVEAIQPQSEEASAVPKAAAVLAVNLVDTHALFDPATSDAAQGILCPVAEFVVQTKYACQVTMSNLSPQPMRGVRLLLQIPEGAVPVGVHGLFTRAATCDLGGNETETVAYAFYFLSPGVFFQFPVHVALQDTVGRRGPFQCDLGHRGPRRR